MFEVDLKDIATLTVPPHKRALKLLALLHAFIAPLVTLYDEFKAYRIASLYQLNYDGSTIHFEKFLNDKFNAGASGINLVTNETVSPLFIPGKAYGGDPVYIPGKSYVGDPPPFVGNKYYYTSQYDFTVEIPAALYATLDLNEVTAFVNKYKLAGKTYNITSI